MSRRSFCVEGTPIPGEVPSDDCLPLCFPNEARSHRALIVKLLSESIADSTATILRALDVYDEFVAYLAEACCSEQEVSGATAMHVVLSIKGGFGELVVEDDPLGLGLFELWHLVREVREARRFMSENPGFTSLN
jgi:hypothetical protein